PVKQQFDFKENLDIPENIISLCSSCHEKIHSSSDARELILELYHSRKKDWEKKGIQISARELLRIYGHTDDGRFKNINEKKVILEQDIRDCSYLASVYDAAFEEAKIPIFPFVGKKYDNQKSKILVIGESHYSTDTFERDTLNAEDFEYRKNITRFVFKHWKYYEQFGATRYKKIHYTKMEEILGDFENLAYYNMNTKLIRRSHVRRKEIEGAVPYLFKVFEILQPDYIFYFSKNAYYNTPESIEGSKVKMLDKDIDKLIPGIRGSHYLVGDKVTPVFAFNHVQNITDTEIDNIQNLIKRLIEKNNS
ncbi:MAG: hypothetical protein ACK5LC_00280, partial [Coprobacillaceae bacterium]